MADVYWALFIDNSANRAWIRRFGESEAPQQGPHSGQSFGSDRDACEAALRELERRGHNA